MLRGKNEFHTSVERALSLIDPKWEKYKGLIICGSHSPDLLDDKLEMIQKAREESTPCLGICMGMQLMAIEYARNVLKLENANTTEIDINTKYPVVIKMDSLRIGIKKVNNSFENHWHNYKFNNDYIDLFIKDWNFTLEDKIVEEMWLKDSPWHMGIQYHPEYGSDKNEQHPLLRWFITTCKENN